MLLMPVLPLSTDGRGGYVMHNGVMLLALYSANLRCAVSLRYSHFSQIAIHSCHGTMCKAYTLHAVCNKDVANSIPADIHSAAGCCQLLLAVYLATVSAAAGVAQSAPRMAGSTSMAAVVG